MSSPMFLSWCSPSLGYPSRTSRIARNVPANTTRIQIARDENNLSKCYGFISFSNFEASDDAIQNMHSQYLMNKEISVQYAYKKDGKGERHGDEAERLLAAQAIKHNVQPAPAAMPPQMLNGGVPPAAPGQLMDGGDMGRGGVPDYNAMRPGMGGMPPTNAYNNVPPPHQQPPHQQHRAMPPQPLPSAPLSSGLPARPPPSQGGYGGPQGFMPPGFNNGPPPAGFPPQGAAPPGFAPPPGFGPPPGLPPPGMPPGFQQQQYGRR